MEEGPLYDRIGVGYANHRRADPAIADLVSKALGSSQTVVSVGTGAGSYEPTDRWVVGVEPSSTMIRQRAPGTAPAVRAVAGHLPLRSSSFDAALAVLTVHHWPDPWAGLAEMRRVARHQIVLTFDPDAHCSHWLTHYIPEMAELFRAAPAVESVAAAIEAKEVLTVPVRYDTPDGMTIAYWRRPEQYLDPAVRAGGSALQQVDRDALERGLRSLEDDLASGRWRTRYRNLLDVESMDYGLRLVVS